MVTPRVSLTMTTLVNTLVAIALGIAWLLGLWLVLVAGSVVLWGFMQRWSSGHMEAPAQSSGGPSAPRFD